MIAQLNHFAETWWTWSASMFWQVSLLIVIVGCIDALLRRWAWPHLRYALWLMVLVKLIIPPTLHLSSSVIARVQPTVTHWMAPSPAKPSPTVTPPAVVDSTPVFNNVSTPTVVPIASEPATVAVAATQTLARSRVPLTWKAVSMLLWLTGILCLGSWLTRKLWILRRNDRKEPPLPESFHLLANQCAARLNLRNCPRFVVTSHVRVPAVMGVFRPVLLMPPGFLAHLSRQDTKHMLLHEFAHIQRGDLKVHGLTLLLQILYWYHPLLWLVTRQMHHLRELCCDATVARHLRDRVLDYRQTLLDVARRYLARPLEPGLGLLGLFEDSNRLAVRLAWLKRKTWRYPRTRRLLMWVLIAMMGACVLPMAQAKSKPETEPVTVVSSPEKSKEKDKKQAEKASTLIEKLHKQKKQIEEELIRLRNIRAASGQSATTYTVQPGDTLWAIAKKFYGNDAPDGAYNTIIRANPPLSASEGLRVGQRLRIPPYPTDDGTVSQPDRDWEEELEHWMNQMQNWTDDLNRMVQDLDVEKRIQQADTWKEEWLNSEAINRWQQDLKDWQQSDEFRYWQKEMQNWGRKIEGFARGKTSDRVDPRAAPTPIPVMPTMPAMPSLPALPVPAPKPIAQHRIKTLVWEAPKDSNVPLRVNNPHGSITLHGKKGRANISVSFIVSGCSREEALKLIQPIEEAMASQGDELHVNVTLPKTHDRRKLGIDVEIALPIDTPVEARTNMGAIRFDNLSAEVEAHTNMGAIALQNVTGDTECRSNIGSIYMVTPNTPNMHVKTTTNIGSIQSDLGMGEIKTRTGCSTNDTYGDGSQPVHLQTNMGSIYIGTESFVEKHTPKTKVTGVKSRNKQLPAVGALASSTPVPSTAGARNTGTAEPGKTKKALVTKVVQQGNRVTATRSIDLAFVYKPNLPVTIRNQNGSIAVAGSNRQDCVIKGQIRCDTPDREGALELARQVYVTPQTGDQGLLIQPTLAQKPTKDQRVTVDLIIELPQDTVLAITHEDGSVSVNDMRGPVRITHEDGAIQCDRLQGPLAIRHEDGHIQIEDQQGPLDIKLEDGFINTLNLLADVDIKLEDGTVKLDCTPKVDGPRSIQVSVLDGTIKLNASTNLLDPESLPKIQHKDNSVRWRYTTDSLKIDLRVNDGSIKLNRE